MDTPKTGRARETTRINCYACEHFYITYDPAFPYGCRAAGFKSRVLPSQEIAAHSGVACLSFSPKENFR